MLWHRPPYGSRPSAEPVVEAGRGQVIAPSCIQCQYELTAPLREGTWVTAWGGTVTQVRTRERVVISRSRATFASGTKKGTSGTDSASIEESVSSVPSGDGAGYPPAKVNLSLEGTAATHRFSPWSPSRKHSTSRLLRTAAWTKRHELWRAGRCRRDNRYERSP